MGPFCYHWALYNFFFFREIDNLMGKVKEIHFLRTISKI